MFNYKTIDKFSTFSAMYAFLLPFLFVVGYFNGNPFVYLLAVGYFFSRNNK